MMPLILLLGAVPAVADVYRWVDEQGGVHFSDTPRAGAERIELKPTTIYTPRPVQTSPAPVAGAPAGQPVGSGGYPDLQIVSPQNDEVVRSNDGRVKVQIRIGKSLRPGDRVRVFMDGLEVASGLSATSLVLTDVDRGTHKLAFSVFSAGSVELARSAEVVFHLQKFRPEQDAGDDDAGQGGSGDDDASAGDSFDPAFTPNNTATPFQPDNNTTPFTPPANTGNKFPPGFTPNYNTN